MTRAPALLLCALLATSALAAPAFADEPTAPKMPKPDPVSAPAYGVENPACMEWTDSCRVCARDAQDAIQCSTPGPACLPKAIVCTRRK